MLLLLYTGATHMGGKTGTGTKRCGACNCRPRVYVPGKLEFRRLPASLLLLQVA